ncbi:formiminoglutamase [Roseibium hamelinense]|uniref:Formiminoglutamase n=1 Tax=Roseibium hamelinense TaxID=150831 RepID=A0A562T1D9_9HYPH|nr:N-formylglutamate amidohydrolase [Roseibium hamelinense]MTI44712.1 formiminoglutamase [Roseibium hamelinense]TWI87342.1 formiminoglutamase [Roseibium hamelinense]
MIVLKRGNSPLILCLPHSGTEVPPAIGGRLSATGRLQMDISWHLDQVLDIADLLDATIIATTISRYVVDVDHDPRMRKPEEEDYARALCPLTTLDGKRLYKAGEEPGPTEIDQRVLLFHDPYHAAVRQQIDRIRRLNKTVLLFDCQSRRSKPGPVPGVMLPIINIGTHDNTSCHPDLRNTFAGSFTGLTGFNVSTDDGVKGRYISQTYGIPESQIHTLTLVIAQRSYLRHETPPFEPDKARMARLRAVLLEGFTRTLDWAGWSGTPQLRNLVQSARATGELMTVERQNSTDSVGDGGQASTPAGKPVQLQTTQQHATAVTAAERKLVRPIIPDNFLEADVAE